MSYYDYFTTTQTMRNRAKPAKTQLLTREAFPLKSRKTLINQRKNRLSAVLSFGTPGAIRTHGLQSRSLTLYPTELRARRLFCSLHIIPRSRHSVKRRSGQAQPAPVSASNIGYTKARERSQGKGGDLRSKYNLTLTVVRKQHNGRGLFGKPCRTALGTLSCGAPAGFTT